MQLKDLIRRFRYLANDTSMPPLWSNEVLNDLFNDALDQACIRGRLIREDQRSDVCQISLTVGQHTYPLHHAVTEIIILRLVPASGQKPRRLRLVSREWLDEEYPEWRDDNQSAAYAIQDDKSLRVVGAIEVGDVMHLECYRLPIQPLTSDMSEPEIHRAHHVHLIQWVLHKAFSVPDADAFDPNRSAQAEAEFTDYFGLMPDSDLRRITREDVVHHNRAHLI